VSSANVHRVAVLSELNDSFVEFSGNLSSQMATIQSQIQETVEWIAQRERYWQDQIRLRNQALTQARNALAGCLAQPRDERRGGHSCNAQEAAVREAKAALDEAQSQLVTAQRWKNSLNSKVMTYLSHANRARSLNNGTLTQASAFLRGRAQELDAYQAASMQSPSNIAAFGNHGAEFGRAKQEMLLRALDDPLVSREIKGWIRQEQRRIQELERALAEGREVPHPNRTYIRMPPGFDAGHRAAGLDTAANLRFEDIWLNRSRWHRARRLGIEDRIR